MLTDGHYAWPASFAYYVQRYNVEIPLEFEQHMASKMWVPPGDVELARLVIG